MIDYSKEIVYLIEKLPDEDKKNALEFIKKPGSQMGPRLHKGFR